MHKEAVRDFVLNNLTQGDKKDLEDYTYSVFYFKDRELYHSEIDLPIAYFYDKNVAIINLSDARVEKDINILIQALENDIEIIQINSNSLMKALVELFRKVPKPCPEDIIWLRGEKQYLLASAIKELVYWAVRNYESFQERLKDSYRLPLALAEDFEEAMTLFYTGERIAVLLECGDYYHNYLPPEFDDISVLGLSEESKIYKDTLNRISKKRDKRIKLFENFFRAGYYFSFYHYHLFPKVLLRIDPNHTYEIESSSNLSFFVSDFKKAFPRILEARQNGYREDARIGLGIRAVYKNGDVIIKRTFVKWEEIERIAKKLKLI